MHWIETVPYTKVFDTRLGPMSVADLYSANAGKISLYNEWGEFGEGTITRIDKRQDVYFTPTPDMLHVSAEYAKNGDKPKFAHRAARKWWIPNRDDERDRRNLFAEHFEVDENGQPVMLFELDEIHKLISIHNILPFYGVSVASEPDKAKLVLDRGRAACFVTKMLPYADKLLEENVRYWREGGWFRTLTPVNDAYLEKVRDTGIFFEGYKGYPDFLPFVILDVAIDKQVDTFYRIEWPKELRLDFGQFML